MADRNDWKLNWEQHVSHLDRMVCYIIIDSSGSGLNHMWLQVKLIFAEIRWARRHFQCYYFDLIDRLRWYCDIWRSITSGLILSVCLCWSTFASVCNKSAICVKYPIQFTSSLILVGDYFFFVGFVFYHFLSERKKSFCHSHSQLYAKNCLLPSIKTPLFFYTRYINNYNHSPNETNDPHRVASYYFFFCASLQIGNEINMYAYYAYALITISA